MKHFGFLKQRVGIAFVALLLASCNSSKLQQAVDAANEACPYELGQLGKLNSVVLEKEYVVFNYEVNEDVFSPDSLKAGEQLAQSLIKNLFANPDNDTKELLKVMVDQRMGMKYVFSGKKSGHTTESLIGADVLKVLVGTEKSVALDKEESLPQAVADSTAATLQNELDEVNKICPLILGNGMTLEKVELEGSYIVYHCTLDENVLTIKAVEKDAQNVKKTMLNAIPKIRQFRTLCKAQEKGLIYRYRGLKSGNTFGIVITTAEMK